MNSNPNEWPVHMNTSLANTTQLWFGNDSEEKYITHTRQSESLALLDQLGWLNTPVPYTFNNQGFRSIPFDLAQEAGIAFGCSITQGVGLPINYVWPTVISNKLDYPIYNMGIGGSSMDTAFRILDYWIPILKPKFVLLACTFEGRIEIANQHGKFDNYYPAKLNNPTFYKEWLVNPINSSMNFKKNLFAIRYICNQHKIPLVDLDVATHFNLDKKARDLAHPGIQAHKDFADKMIEKLSTLL